MVVYHGKDLTIWPRLVQYLNNLEYWSGKRNEIIHSGKGIFKTTMAEILASDRKSNRTKALEACDANDVIISELGNILRNTFELCNNPSSKSLEYLGTRDDVPYYIYTEVAEWIINYLNTKGLEEAT